ncbi:MAG: globin, partial [Sphingomonadales bacterium 39-62-4]
MTPYDAFGGDAFVRSLCARFYALMDALPEAAACRAVHPPSLARAEEKLVEYLT